MLQFVVIDAWPDLIWQNISVERRYNVIVTLNKEKYLPT